MMIMLATYYKRKANFYQMNRFYGSRQLGRVVKHPIKVAPYTESMLDTFKRNVCACLLLGTSTKRGDFKARSTDTILYGLAPLPYATGLLPLAFEEEIGIEFLPPVKDAVK